MKAWRGGKSGPHVCVSGVQRPILTAPAGAQACAARRALRAALQAFNELLCEMLSCRTWAAMSSERSRSAGSYTSQVNMISSQPV